MQGTASLNLSNNEPTCSRNSLHICTLVKKLMGFTSFERRKNLRLQIPITYTYCFSRLSPKKLSHLSVSSFQCGPKCELLLMTTSSRCFMLAHCRSLLLLRMFVTLGSIMWCYQRNRVAKCKQHSLHLKNSGRSSHYFWSGMSGGPYCDGFGE